MKKYSSFSLFVFMLFIFNLPAQESDFIPDSNVYWNINETSMGYYSPHNPYGVIGDTVIGANEYLQIHQSMDTIWNSANTTYFCGARAENNKWFFVPDGDTLDYLLYDFDVEVGDTIYTNNPWYDEPESYPYVNAIDSVLIEGEYKKRIDVGHYQYPLNWGEYWIEGIGSTFGLIYSGHYSIDWGFQLFCFHENDEIIFNNAPNGDCDFTTGIKDLIKDDLLDVFPNPVSENLSIKIKNSNHAIEQVMLYDFQGNLINSDLVNGKQLHNLSLINIVPGIYILEVRFKDGQSSFKKIIKQ